MDNFRQYLEDISSAYEKGDATEHTYRPFLKTLVESIQSGIIATNEPSHIKVGAPDFNIRSNKLIIGHIECKDVGKDLRAESKSDQLKRYRANLPNLILTDYIDFIWFREGKEIDKSHLARRDSKGKWKLDTDELPRLQQLLDNFLAVEPEEIGDSRKLAEALARPARMIRDTIRGIFKHEEEEGKLHNQLAAFQETLLPDLEPDDFADLYAQTIAYGLFAARTELDLPAKDFTWETAFFHLPKANPFLKSLFSKMVGPDAVEPRIKPWMEELALILSRSDMYGILEDFGKKTKQEDPVVHFYETFIGAYDRKMKKARGVYYTPQPVISYIVRSIDYLLRERFGKRDGLADKNVYILDPACGTGSFLLEVLRLIRGRIPRAGWNDYVRKYLLHRLFGFELLMAPYIISHLKLGLYLKETGFEFDSRERLGVYLTNTLEPEVGEQERWSFAGAIAEEGWRAQKVKQEEPIMVVLGNPPYSDSVYKGKWILQQVEDYKKGLKGKEKKFDVTREELKFLKFAQCRIERTGHGIVGYIINNSFLDAVTLRRIRESLRETFEDIYVFDLHGSVKKGEVPPEALEDENVFDIQQGVTICLQIKQKDYKDLAKVYHTELWGNRNFKYQTLSESEFDATDWIQLHNIDSETCLGKFYFFTPKAFDNIDEYCQGWSIKDVFKVYQNAVKTDRDKLFLDFNKEILEKRIQTFYSDAGLKLDFREKYNVNNSSSYGLLSRRNATSFDSINIQRFIYRPFNERWIYYSPTLTSRAAWDVMSHMLAGDNLGLITTRQTVEEWGALATQHICGHKSCAAYDINSLFPLYLYPTPKKAGQQDLHEEEIKGRKPNLAPVFIAELEEKLGVTFIPDSSLIHPHPKEGKGRGGYITPEDVFHYIYAVLHSPTYRSRYAEFLKIDFPRVPFTHDKKLFRNLVSKGHDLVKLHLMESDRLDPSKSGVDLEGPLDLGNEVEKLRYDDDKRRVYINKKQYFSGVEPDVWNFHVGGYQVCHKWLKDRKGRKLSYDDITHYQKIVIALRETISLMEQIDGILTPWPWQRNS